MWTYPFAERFPQITQPVLILQPHEDLLDASRRALDLLADAEFVSLPGLTRDVLDVGVEEYAREMRRFLN